MTISELIDHIGLNKRLQAETYKSYAQLKEVEEGMKFELMEKLREAGAKSFKAENYLAAITSRSDIKVTHEQSVLNWLKETPDVEYDAYVGLKLKNLKQLATQVLKQTGEIIPGTESVLKESLTIKENK